MTIKHYLSCAALAFAILSSTPVAHAAPGEAELACNLEKAKTEVSARLMEAPYASGSLGDSSVSQQSLTVALSQSMSGRSRAQTLRAAAELKCQAIGAQLVLEDYRTWRMRQLAVDAARTEIQALAKPRTLSRTNLKLLVQQLQAQTITIIQYEDAKQQLLDVENRRLELLKTAAQEIPMVQQPTSVPQMVMRAQEYESQAAALTAKAVSDTGWDVVVSGGIRQPLSSGKPQSFLTMTARYSFGLEDSKAAAAEVGAATLALLDKQQSGYKQGAERQALEVQKLLEVEQQASSHLQAQIERNTVLTDMIKDIDSTHSQNVRRSLILQISILQASLSGSEARIRGLQEIQQTLK